MSKFCIVIEHKLKLQTAWKMIPYIFMYTSYWYFAEIVTRLTRQVPLLEQKLLILPEHPSSHPDFSGVRVIRSLGLCVCCVGHCLSVCPLCCLSLFYLRILITPLVSSNYSYKIWNLNNNNFPLKCIIYNSND